MNDIKFSGRNYHSYFFNGKKLRLFDLFTEEVIPENLTIPCAKILMSDHR